MVLGAAWVIHGRDHMEVFRLTRLASAFRLTCNKEILGVKRSTICLELGTPDSADTPVQDEEPSR